MRQLFIQLILLCCCQAMAEGQAQPEISWYYSGSPPLYITSGPLLGQGYLDQALRQVIVPSLPEYRHRFVESALTRALHDVQQRPNVCILGLYRTAEREPLMLFSQPFIRVLPISVAVRSNELARLQPFQDQQGRVVLQALLQAQSMKLGVVADRSYGSEIDAILASFAGEAQLDYLSAANASRSLLGRLALRRGLDLALAYPYELRFLGETGGLQAGQLSLLPIAEAPPTLPGYLACSRSALGAEVINKLNQLLAEPQRRQKVLSYYERWLDDAARQRLQAGQAKHVE